MAIVLAIAASAYYFWPFAPSPVAPVASSAAPSAPKPQGPRYPMPEAAPQPLPRLAESDVTVLEALSGVAGSQSVRHFFNPEDVIRHLVATIDNLPRKTFAARLNPVRPPEGLSKTKGKEASLTLAPENAARYTPYVHALESVDAARLVALYIRLYPLFQQAYVELGYPNGYFNDRLVEVIDHLLATAEVKGPVKLTVTHVLYEFADPELESASAGQKLLIRMGPENAARVKAKLRDIRRELAAQAPPR
ncbi:MAG TPA: DUF3014 domain-containing protein [Usitatibacter sp.]|nr:DUF3014 domain-containing protein [Usitatibacter sp.]